MDKKTAEVINVYDKLTCVKFEMDGKVYEVDVGGELLVGSKDLHSQVEKIPAVLGYFSSIVALLEKEYKNKEVLRKKIEAKIDKKIRLSGVIGETRIERAIRRHPKWGEACMHVNDAKEKYYKARFLYYALKEKSVILLSRSSDIRSNPEDSIRGVTRRKVMNQKKKS